MIEESYSISDPLEYEALVTNSGSTIKTSGGKNYWAHYYRATTTSVIYSTHSTNGKTIFEGSVLSNKLHLIYSPGETHINLIHENNFAASLGGSNDDFVATLTPGSKVHNFHLDMTYIELLLEEQNIEILHLSDEINQRQALRDSLRNYLSIKIGQKRNDEWLKRTVYEVADIIARQHNSKLSHSGRLYRQKYLQKALNLLNSTDLKASAITIPEIAEYSNCSVRTLEMCFQLACGMSVKEYSRQLYIYRISQYLSQNAHAYKRISDFYDEMDIKSPGRFASEFKSLIGVYPKDII
jgi:AraC-like DNA-binding protein